MRAAVLYGPNASARDLRPFESQDVIWLNALPNSLDDCDAILIFGGDGTIHRHLSDLVRLQRPVLIVPSGSGNDFARSIGVPKVRDAVYAWKTFLAKRSNTRAVDLGIIASKGSETSPIYFSCLAGIGIGNEAARRASAMPRWLRANGGYAAGLLQTLPHFTPVETTIRSRATSTSEMQNHPRKAVTLAAFANTPYYGGGMRIAPRARMNSGLLDACIIEGMNPFKLFCLFPTVYFGRHLNIKAVEYFPVFSARLETEIPVDVYADGEFVCQTPVEISAQPAALPVIVPEKEKQAG